MEQFNLPLEEDVHEKPISPPEQEEPEVICGRCGMPKVNGICNCNRPFSGPERSPFKKRKK
jgi:hypothetical protein